MAHYASMGQYASRVAHNRRRSRAGARISASHLPLASPTIHTHTPTRPFTNTPFLPLLPVVVVLAVLAFFALRPGKGWLRRQTAPTPHTSVSSRPSSKLATPILSLASEYDGDNCKSEPGSPPLLPGSKPLALSMLSDVEAPHSPEHTSRSLQGSALRDSRSLPDSYVSTGVSSSALLTFREPGPRSVRCMGLGEGISNVRRPNACSWA